MKKLLTFLLVLLFLILVGVYSYLFIIKKKSEKSGISPSSLLVSPTPVVLPEESLDDELGDRFVGKVVCEPEEKVTEEEGVEEDEDTCRIGLKTENGEFFYLAYSKDNKDDEGKFKFSDYLTNNETLEVLAEVKEELENGYRVLLVNSII